MAHPITKQRPGSGAHAPAPTIAAAERILAHRALHGGSGTTAAPPTVTSARQETAGAAGRRAGSGAAKG